MSMPSAPPGTVPIADSVDELLDGCEQRDQWKTTDSLSGSRFERVVIAGIPHVVKYISVDDDWIMRATGDLGWRQFTLWSSGVLAALPASIDHAIVGCAPFTSDRGRRALAILMRDVSASMVPPGGEPISLALHRSFIDHMAAFHAAFWGLPYRDGLFPVAHHYVILTPTMSELEATSPHADPVPPAVGDGWRRIDERYPAQARLLRKLAADPGPLLAALQEGPQTLIHGDWKLGNLGHEDGRTILLDWDRTGVGAPAIDVAWYLAVNCDRLPESKEDTIDAYRAALESAGVATASWWASQLEAALAGAFLQLAWSKTDDTAEFGWWSDRFNTWRR